jgi:sporulation protein YunB
MYKIYSRKRLRVKNFKNKGKITKIILILVIAFETAELLLNHINPIFERISIYEAKKLATFVANDQTTKVMQNYNYDSMFSIEKDADGNVSMIQMNMYRVNIIISDIAYYIQEQMKKPENCSVSIPMGNVLGIDLFSGYGPNIKMKVVLLGTVETDLRSEFIAKGINQTLHRVYLQIDCPVQILSSYKTMEENISNQFLLAENVIVGQIPSTYYNLESFENPVDTMEAIN